MAKLGKIMLVLLGLAFVCQPAGAIQVTVNPAADTHVTESAKDSNYGQTGWLKIKGPYQTQQTRTLMRFDLSAYAGDFADPGFQVNSAKFRFLCFDDIGGPDAPYTNWVKAIHQDNNAWIEGTADGAVQNGSPSWNSLAHGSTVWAGGPNGLGTASDVRTDWGLIATFEITPSATNPQWWEADIASVFDDGSTTVEQLLQSWAGLPGAYGAAGVNPGILLENDRTGSTYVMSKEIVGQYEGPAELVIDYIPEPATMALLALGALGLIRRRRA